MALCSLGCERGCPKGSIFDICPTCRAAIARWSERARNERVQYQEQLTLRTARLTEISEASAGSYVTLLRAKRRRRA